MAVARISFKPRQKGKPGVWGRSPMQWGPGVEPLVRGLGAKPPEAESFSVVGCPKEMENVLQFYYFTPHLLFIKNILSCIIMVALCNRETIYIFLYTTMLW